MKKSEVMKLLTVVAAAERSGWVPTPEDATLWHAFAVEGAWESYDAALRAYVVHRSEQPNFPLRPGHITQVLERVRRSSSASFDLESEQVPAAVQQADDFDAAYLAWTKRRAAEHRAAAIGAFARGEGPAPRAIEAAS